MGAYFIYNGINSRDKGVVLKKLPPITRPKRRIETIEVPGRSGTLHIDEETFEPITISLECVLKRNYDARSITSWLQEFGRISFSDEPDKYYEATIVNSIPLSRVFKLYREFIIQLELQPIALSTNEYTYTINDTQEHTLQLDTAIKTFPYIKLTGSGQVQLTINNSICTITIDDGYIEIDSNLQNAYKGNVAKNDKMNGEFPVLLPGTNTIQITGNATMEMKYRKAYI